MTGSTIDLAPAADQVTALLRGIQDDDLPHPTPCALFSVGDLVDHLDKSCRGLATVAGAPRTGPDDTAEPPDASHLPFDWRRTVGAHVDALVSAWSDPAAWKGRFPVTEDTDLPCNTWGRIALAELVVYGWDLARATGRSFQLPDDLLRACLDHLVAFVPAAPVPELWGEQVELPPDAPLLDRVAAAAGRRP